MHGKERADAGRKPQGGVTRDRRAALASLLLLIGQLATLVVTLWATPRILVGLGDARYGVLALISSFVAYFAYLELGIGVAYMREIGVAFEQKDLPRMQVLFETAQAIYLGTGLVGATLMLVVGLPYLHHAVSSPELTGGAYGGLLITAGIFAGTMTLSSTRGLVMAGQRLDVYAWLALVTQPLIPLGQILAIVLGGGIVGVLAVQAVAALGVDLILLFFARKLVPELRVRARFHAEVWRELRNFSLYKFVGSLTQQVQLTADRVIVGSLLPIEAVTMYALPGSIALRVRVLATAVLGPFFPTAVASFARGGEAGLAATGVSFGRRLSVLLALAIAGAGYLAQPFLRVWVGESYAEQGAAILQVLMFSVSFTVLSELLGQLTDAAGLPRPATVAGVIGALVAVGASIAVAGRFGVLGVAYAFLLGATVQLALALNNARLVVRGGWVSLCAYVVGRPALVGVVAWATMRVLPASGSFTASLAIGAAGGLVGIACAFAVGALDRSDVPGWLARRLGGGSPPAA